MTVSGIETHPVGPLQHADRMIVARPIRLIGPRIFVSIPLPDSTEPARPVLYGKSKIFVIGDDIRFRLVPKGKAYLFRIKSQRWKTFHGRYDILDAEGNRIGLVDKSVRRSQAQSHYRLFDAAGNEVLEGQEPSMSRALLRRFWDKLRGLFSEFLLVELDFVPDLPDHFDLYLEGQRVGRYRRLSLRYDRSLLELEPELADVDRRLLVAFVVALDDF